MAYIDFHQFNITLYKDTNYASSEDVHELEAYLNNFTSTLIGIPLENFRKICKYRKAYRYFYTLSNIVTIYCDPAADNKNTIYVEIHGLACDALNIDYKQLIEYCYTNGHRISNIHIYLDDTANLLPFDRLVTEFKPDRNRIITNAKKILLLDSTSRTLEFGSKYSDLSVTIYEKGIYEGVSFAWQRVEIKLSDAEMIRKHLTDYLNEGLAAIAKGLLYSAIDFKVDGPGPKAKRATEQFWVEFLDNVSKRKLGRIPAPKPDDAKRLQNLINHVTRELAALGDVAATALAELLKPYHIAF